MTEETALFLLSPEGRALTARNTADDRRVDVPALVMKLRREATADRASAIAELIDARRRATAKFGELAGSMFFTREALEQASSAGAAAYHARRFVDAGVRHVVDLCGGIGGDAIAFARAGLRVTLCEIDPARALFARENAEVAGLADRIDVRNVDGLEAFRTLEYVDAVWFDPARRVDGRRRHAPDEYVPPISTIAGILAAAIANVGVKLSPAVDHAVGDAYGAQLEFLSDQGECKEGLLWTGRLMNDGAPAGSVVATVLRNGEARTLFEEAAEARHAVIGTDDLYLYEPDPAVIRAHLVSTVGAQIGANVIDPQIAYLIGPVLVDTPFARAYRILDRFPYHVNTLQRKLKEAGVGKVVIKKRGFPEEPDAVRKQLKLAGDREMVVVLTRVGLKHQAILCEPEFSQ